MKKRVFSILLAFCIMLSLLPGTARAAGSSMTGAEFLETADGSGNIVLTEDVTLTSYVHITDQKITVNLNNHKLTRTTGATLFYVTGGTLEVNNGTIESKPASGEGAVWAQGNSTVKLSGVVISATGESNIAVDVRGSSNVTMTNCTITSDYAPVAVWQGAPTLMVIGSTLTSKNYFGLVTHGSNTGPNTNITVDRSIIESKPKTACGIYLPAGILTIKDGSTISGGAGIVVRGGTLKMEGGTVTATGTGTVDIGDASYPTVPAAGIAVDKNSAYNKGNVSVSISGGTVNGSGENAAVVTFTENGKDTGGDTKPAGISITGGTFSGSVSRYVDSKYKFEAKNSSGYSYYQTEKEAQAAAGSSGSYKQLGDNKDKSSYYPITIDVNDKTGGTYTAVGIENNFAAAGAEVTVTAKPNEGYAATLSATVADAEIDKDKNTIAFKMPEKAVTVTVTFKKSDGKEDPEQTEGEGHTITFDPNGGTLPKGTGTTAKTKDGKLSSLPVPTRTGYNFSGWYTAKDTGGERVTINTEFKGDTTLYARWAKMGDYLISVKCSPAKGGDVTGDGWYDKGESVTLSAYPARGYLFDCWEDEDGEMVSTRLDYAFTVTEDLALTAVFVPDDYDNVLNYPVTTPAVANGSVSITHETAKSGTRVTITARPNSGYTTSSVTVTDRNGRVIPATNNGNGTWTFTMPASRTVVSVVFTAIGAPDLSAGVSGQIPGGNLSSDVFHGTPWVSPVASVSYGAPWNSPFIDVTESDWFYNEVSFAVRSGLMNGVGNQRFDPGNTTTRGMVMTMLARMAGVDTGSSIPWYRLGMSWAMRADVSNGADPEADITREEFATMLWRYAGRPAAAGTLGIWYDAGDVHDWAGTAMIWAVQNGIINGSYGRLNPLGHTTRSEAAAMLARFCRNVGA